MTQVHTPKKNWQEALIQALSDPEELCRLLDLDASALSLSSKAHAQFPLKVPRGFVARMKKGDPKDPLLLQVLNQVAEERLDPAYGLDPLEEAKSNPLAGLLHKYQSRVLLTLTATCAINCRFCFRRHFPYADNNPSENWEKAFAYIREHEDVNEVILSGGDPLMLNDRSLTKVSEQLATLPQITRLRIHSRIPVVLPERLDSGFLGWVKSLKQRLILILHCNHANELDESVREALKPLKEAGVLLLNQTVLLKGINDCAEGLATLSEKLFSFGVLPYYLHVLDKVQGAAHFDMPEEEALKIHNELSFRLPGYLLPKLVREVPGAKAKVVIR